MATAPQFLGGNSRCGRLLGPSLDKIIKNAAWRKHSHLVSACKSTLDKFDSITDLSTPDLLSPVPSIPSADAELALSTLLLAIDTASSKVVEPALDCFFKLFSLNLIHGEVDRSGIHHQGNSNASSSTSSSSKGDNSKEVSKGSMVSTIIESVCKLCSSQDEVIELAVLRVLLSAVGSSCVVIRGDYLVHIVKTCYNVYLGGANGTNQICAKAVLAQIMVIVFARVEADSMVVDVKTVSVAELLVLTDRDLSDGNSVQLVQSFIYEVMEVSEGVKEIKQLAQANTLENGDIGGNEGDKKGEEEDDEQDGKQQAKESKIHEDGFMLFKNLCKLSMKFSTQEHSDDQILLRGKILSLELLKIIMDNAGPIWRTNDRFLNIIKQFLCLSLLKNSALTVMTIFQLLCQIFSSLLSKFRSALKAEIGIFFPMLILRVLENILQPSFMQKMTVLNVLNKISEDPQIIVDIFVNYDCDLDAPNIYERTVNGLHKTALGPPHGSTTNLSPVQDLTFRVESVKCLVSIVKSMGSWMDQQMKIVYAPNKIQIDNSGEYSSSQNEEGAIPEYDPEASSEMSDAATLEQRRAYKLEFQKGISLFNRKPAKGVEFLINTKKVGGSPEKVAAFLKNAVGLNPAMIGDYLGDREDFPLRVMHAYVDSFDFEKMDFGEAIRHFLQGFRLPGEAQKIDRIMEKFAERYCKCNPNSFATADTAYVLAYSVIMLNTDAHNPMVKEKMTKADFIRNNRGIDDGKDLPEEYLGILYDQIVKNEIKMNDGYSEPQSKQVNGLRLLGLDGILNLVTGKQAEEKPMGANGLLIKHIQEQFKAKAGKSESVFYSVSDVAILRFMVEVCWGPMLAAFSMTLDQSDDRLATAQCLQGFRYAIHVTAVLGMQTQRDAFVTSLAKFTYLHNAVDMKQKNVDAMKTIMTIAVADGNHLQEAWEHILMCLSRFEHLQLLGEGVPLDASFLNSNTETDDIMPKSGNLNSLKKRGTLHNSAVMAVVRGGSYDSSTLVANTPKLVTPEQVNNFIGNLHLLEQIGSYELNHVFAHSQRLNSEAIVSFVKALCKVAMSELQSPTDPRVFSLTKIVEIAHYNMNRIRLVWSRIWSVLSDFFVSVGLSQNLSVAIFVMDSLRQLAMKFLEREELANYSFQNEFLRPFVIVMKKSNSAEIRELIVRCISQMVLSRVSNVKSGWKSVFLVFTTAAADERKSIVSLAFETMEKIVREYFPYITETESITFTDCVRCLITFTKSGFTSDVSLNAIAFLRFCAVKLAEGGLICSEESKDEYSYIQAGNEERFDGQVSGNKDENVYYWMPLLTGLSKLTSDPRPAIRKTSLEVLFNILRDHGHLFSRPFWIGVLKAVVFPMFNSAYEQTEADVKVADDDQISPKTENPSPRGGSMWDQDTCVIAANCLVDLFTTFFGVLRCELPSVVSILAGYIKNPSQAPARTGVSALGRLTSELGGQLTESDWRGIFMALHEAATASTIPGFMKVLGTMNNIEFLDSSEDMETSSGQDVPTEMEDDELHTAAYVVSRMKSHIAVQLVILQVIADLYKKNQESLSASSIKILLEIFSSISGHASHLSSDTTTLQRKLQKACALLELSEPPVVHFENESLENHLSFLRDVHSNKPSFSSEIDVEPRIISVCEKIFNIYLRCSAALQKPTGKKTAHWIVPLGSAQKEELVARTPLLLSALRALSGLESDSFRRNIGKLLPLLVNLVKSEHGTSEVTLVLSDVFQNCIGPVVMTES